MIIKTIPLEEVLVIKLNDWEKLNLSNYVFEKIKKLIQVWKYWIKFDNNICKFFNLIERLHYNCWTIKLIGVEWICWKE